VTALPASVETVACYVADLAKVAKPATIDARLAAISSAHRAAGYDTQPRRRRSVWYAVACAGRLGPPSVRCARSRCLTRARCSRDSAATRHGVGTGRSHCSAVACALRRRELVSLDVTDITQGSDGLTVRLRRSKTDQEGRAHCRHPLRVEPGHPARFVLVLRGARPHASQRERLSDSWTATAISAQHD